MDLSDLLKILGENLSLFFSFIAILISIISVYYTYWQGPRFRIQLLSKEKIYETTNSVDYEYYFVIVNNGNKTGIIKKLTSQTSSNIEIIREKPSFNLETPQIIRGKDTHPICEEEPFFIVGIEPKESVIIKCRFKVYAPLNSLPDYKILFVLDKNVRYESLSDKDKKEIAIEKE